MRWGILEWNPSLPVSNSLDVYQQEMALIERYRPGVVVPWAWGDPFYQVQNSPFETTLRDLIARMKDGPPRAAPLPAFNSDVTLPSPAADRVHARMQLLRARDAILERDRAATVGRVQGRRER